MNSKYLFFIVLLCTTQAQAVSPSLVADGYSKPVSTVNRLSDTAVAVDTADTDSQSTVDGSVFPDYARITLINKSGQELDIGEIVFSVSGTQETSVSVEMYHDQFDDQFLSMRPFRCLTDPSEWFCYLPYPYKINNTISSEDLTNLEYQLLFIWKSPKDFGIDAWNGVYYQLEANGDGTLSGTLLQGDLNVLANPPEPYSYPINLNEFIAEGAKNRLYPELIIRPIR